MQGFFTKEIVDKLQKGRADIAALPRCAKCKLYQGCISPKMPATGEGKKRILFIAEAPGKTEDERNKQLVGKAGKMLRKTLLDVGISLDLDCRKINAINCRPPDNRTPTDKEIEFCRPLVIDEVKRFKPHLIVLLGGTAVESFYGHRWDGKKTGGINKWRGFAIPDQDYDCWVVATFHPSYVLREEYRPAIKLIFENDIDLALSLLDKPVPKRGNDIDSVVLLEKPNQVKRYLLGLRDLGVIPMAFDYECSGLKPHAPGHFIHSCAISTELGIATAFHVTEDIKPYLADVLTDPNIYKIGANMKYEECWTENILGVEVKNWLWDTCIGAHVLDNRQGITGLKFQSFLHFGVLNWGTEVEKYLHVENSNAINKIKEADQHMVLKYNGLDALYTYELAKIQMEQMGRTDLLRVWDGRPPRERKGPLFGYDLLHEGTLCLGDMEQNGVPIDVEYTENQMKHLKRKIRALNEELLEFEGIQLWQSTYGKKFNLDSGEQLGAVLKKLGYKNIKITEKGNISTGEAALEKLKLPWCDKLLEYKRLEKVRNTYVRNYLIEQVDGIMHPGFSLNLVVSYRSQSSKPNQQNVPVRIPYIKKAVRRAIVPYKDMAIVEADYAQIEVRAAACEHKDPNMILEITDPSKDMHRDMAVACYKLDLNDWTKIIRFCAKGGFVFSQFYGDWYQSCAKKLWDYIGKFGLETRSGKPMLDHLKDVGLGRYKDFENHIKNVERDFWEKRFPVYNKWRDSMVDFYNEHGYTECPTGFRFQGDMKRNEVINYVIQGPAFHCLLWSAIHINKILKAEKTKTRLNMQIHDSLLGCTCSDEYSYYLNLLKDVMCNQLPKEWDWIIVPLDIEIEVAPLNESWYYKREVKHVSETKDIQCQICGAEWLYENELTAERRIEYECPMCGGKYEGEVIE